MFIEIKCQNGEEVIINTRHIIDIQKNQIEMTDNTLIGISNKEYDRLKIILLQSPLPALRIAQDS